MRRATYLLTPVLALTLVASGLGACSGDEDADPASPAATGTTGIDGATTTHGDESGCTTAETGPLRIVLINDDGVTNPAIDVLIDSLPDDDDLQLDITVVAPADERSGTSDTTTPGGATYTETTTVGGNEAYAVDGFPADAVIVALEELDLDPHLVVSGINPGQNFGPVAAISGTVGAARTAVRRDVPALAVSAAFEFDDAQFEVGAQLATEWIEERCEELIEGTYQTDTLDSINLPNCAPEDMGPLQEVPRATELPDVPEGEDIFESDCDLADPEPPNDVAAVRSGYPAISPVEPEL
ncbi:MAG: 5'/3'-nucleotidase SurE [Acidimicrobiia bacterium]|nr:5'/3'-nucleotidase SurE [Acidimicrobiia bacterium]